MKLTLQSLLTLVFVLGNPTSTAFIHPGVRFSLQHESTGSLQVAKDIFDGSDSPLDLERAKQCAGSFGECPVEEIERLRDELQSSRVKSLMWSDIQGGGAIRDYSETEIMEHYQWEKDLNFQLRMLQKHLDHHEALFPSSETSVGIETQVVSTEASAEYHTKNSIVTTNHQVPTLDGSTHEALVLCVFLAAVVFLPNFG